MWCSCVNIFRAERNGDLIPSCGIKIKLSTVARRIFRLQTMMMMIGAIDTLMMTMVMLMKIAILNDDKDQAEHNSFKIIWWHLWWLGELCKWFWSVTIFTSHPLELPTLCTLTMNFLSRSKSHPVDDSFCLWHTLYSLLSVQSTQGVGGSHMRRVGEMIPKR